MGRNSWSNQVLFDHLFKNKTERTYWDNISELRKRGTTDLLSECILLTKSEYEKKRRIGADILAQLSTPSKIKPFSEQIITHFISLLKIEKSPLVLGSILFGIGHNKDYLISDKDIKLVSSYRDHQDNFVREGVVFALLGIDNPIAIRTLIELSKDKSSDIRDWATFGIGSQIERNTPEIRDALYNRAYDKHEETKEEAIVGLAIRKDPRVKAIIEQELLSDAYGSLLFEAIEELQDTTLLPLLEESLRKNKDTEDINPDWIEKLKDCINSLESLNKSQVCP